MTSEEIRAFEGQYTQDSTPGWLREIAYQLAKQNENSSIVGQPMNHVYDCVGGCYFCHKQWYIDMHLDECGARIALTLSALSDSAKAEKGL